MTPDADPWIERATPFLMTEVDGEAVLMDACNDRLFVLEGPAPRVWMMLETPARLSDLVARLCAEYAVGADTCRSDVAELLERLNAFGAVQLS